MTEAGFIERTAAGFTPVDEALRTIGDRPIALRIGQELPPGREYDVIREDIDRCVDNPRILMAYTGMHWHNRDVQEVIDLHQRLDEYWQERMAD